MLTILVADDEIGGGNTAADKLVSRLEASGYAVTGVATSKDAIHMVQQERWDVAIVDLRWQREGDTTGKLGWEIVRSLRRAEQNANSKIILYSGYLDPNIVTDAGTYQVIAVPKMRPAGPPPSEEEHLTSLLTMVRSLRWLIDEADSLRDKKEAAEKELQDLREEIQQSEQSRETQRLRGILVLLSASAFLAVGAVIIVRVITPNLTATLPVMLLVLFFVLVSLAAMGWLPESMVKFFANRFGKLFIGKTRD